MAKHAPDLTAIEAQVAATMERNRLKYGGFTMTGPAGDPTGQTVVLPPAPPAPAPAPTVQTFTADDIERARQQEKDKLYETIEAEKAARLALEQRMEAFSTDLTARQQAQQQAEDAAAAALEEKRLNELSLNERMTEFQQQQDARVAGLEQQLHQSQAVIEQERRFTELMQYRSAALQSEVGQTILPELRDFVAGNTTEEIDSAVSALAAKSEAILVQMAQATGAARQSARGVGVTAPPVGPLDTNSDYQTVSADDIRGMDMQTYAQNRARLLGAAANQQRDRGMFG